MLLKRPRLELLKMVVLPGKIFTVSDVNSFMISIFSRVSSFQCHGQQKESLQQKKTSV